MNNSDKTIPYRPSQADLENLRLLRRRTQPSDSTQGDETSDASPEESNPSFSNPDPEFQTMKNLLRIRRGILGS
jgi:hypothetical protein